MSVEFSLSVLSKRFRIFGMNRSLPQSLIEFVHEYTMYALKRLMLLIPGDGHLQ